MHQGACQLTADTRSRRTFVKTVGLGATVSLAGCLGGDDADDLSIHFATLEGGEGYDEIWQGMQDDYEEKYDAELEITEISGVEEFVSLLRSPEPPEVIEIDVASFAEPFEEGLFTPVSEVYDDIMAEIDIDDRTILQRDGEIYSLPVMKKLHHTTIRADLFEEVGADLDPEMSREDFLQYTEEINEEMDQYGTIVSPAVNSRGSYEAFQFLWSHGVTIWEGPSGETEVVLDQGENRERAIDCCEYIEELNEFSPDGAGFHWGDNTEAFVQDQTASVQFSGGNLLAGIGHDDLNDPIYENVYGIMNPYPEDLGIADPQGYEGTGHMALLENSNNPDQGREFIKDFYLDGHIFDFCLGRPLFLFPATPDLANDDRHMGHDIIQHHDELRELKESLLDRNLSPILTADDFGINSPGGEAFLTGEMGSLLTNLLTEEMDPGDAVDSTAENIRQFHD